MDSLKRLKQEVWRANVGIYRAGLVTMHSGNASGIDRRRGLVVIKPSGMDYDKLRPVDLAVTDLEGRQVEGRWKPSVDLPHHLYLYQHCPDVGGIIHTHSNYATAFALLEKPIPPYLTAIADEFGGTIPCAPYVDNQGNHIGEAIVAAIQSSHGRVPAVLLAHHGAFAFGPTVEAAFKAAVMLEDVAKTCHLALTLGKPKPLPTSEVEKWYERYHTTYGQKQKPSRSGC
jgi:L-ribulose-5-phosphate 4-epimerase